ncbi:ATP-binding cassette domain-containing protein [Corynebacterium kroppenstedtii]|uniref:ABC transporter ATP-binding protein n=1 Tax=Corynebacterium sp. PCR 32 TaxID=3351342 RepID=UPI00309A37CF
MSCVLLDNADIGRKNSILVQGVSLSLEHGDIIRITGANGTGKSTLASTILGTLPPLSGRRGHRLPNVGSSEHQRFFGYMPASVRPLPSLTINQWFQAIDSGFTVHAGASQHLWNRLGGSALPNSTLETLSSGNLRKACAVNAFAIPREVLILDEPFEELDSESRSILRHMIEEQARAGARIIIISHSECGPVTGTYIISNGTLSPQE